MLQTPEPLTTYNLPVDATSVVISSAQQLCECGERMGPLRVYKGKGKLDRRHLKGALVQTCSSKKCHHTIYHTNGFNTHDAEEFVHRYQKNLAMDGLTIRAPPLTISIPPSHLRDNASTNPSLSSPMPSSPTQPSSDDVEPGKCTYPGCWIASARKRRTANQNCIGQMCKTHCNQTAKECQMEGTGRSECKCHSSNAVVPAVSSQAPTASASITSKKVGQQESLTSGVTSSTPADIESLPRPSRTNPLARPLTDLWTSEEFDVEAARTQSVYDARRQQQQIQQDARKTVKVHVYYEANKDARVTQATVATFPHLRLSDVPALSRAAEHGGFGLSPNTIMAYYSAKDNNWMEVDFTQVVEVDKTGSLVVRYIAVEAEDCPGWKGVTGIKKRARSSSIDTNPIPSKSAKTSFRCVDSTSERDIPDQLSQSPDLPEAYDALKQSNPVVTAHVLDPSTSAAREVLSIEEDDDEEDAGVAKWTQLSVKEVIDGLDEMRMRKEEKAEKHKDTFSKIFNGHIYVKSSVGRIQRDIVKHAKDEDLAQIQRAFYDSPQAPPYSTLINAINEFVLLRSKDPQVLPAKTIQKYLKSTTASTSISNTTTAKKEPAEATLTIPSSTIATSVSTVKMEPAQTRHLASTSTQAGLSRHRTVPQPVQVYELSSDDEPSFIPSKQESIMVIKQEPGLSAIQHATRIPHKTIAPAGTELIDLTVDD